MRVQAYAKINLGLEVLGRRADGLHEIASVLQTIDLADRLEFASSDAVTLRCRGMAATADNSILQAAHLLRKVSGVQLGCAIVCEKRIPVAAGLGGGSADAAATLRALNRFWGTGLTPNELLELAAQLGADVPHALQGGTALATGSGRTIQLLPDAPRQWLVLVPLSAGAEAKTAEMYRSLTAEDFSDGTRTRAQAQALHAGRIEAAHVSSAFTRPAAERWPEVQRALSLLGETAAAVCVSGAGPSAFALYAARGQAIRVVRHARMAGLTASLRRFVGAGSASGLTPF